MMPNKVKALIMGLSLVVTLLVGVGSTAERRTQAASYHCVPKLQSVLVQAL